MLVSMGDNAPQPVQKKLQKLLGSSTSVQHPRPRTSTSTPPRPRCSPVARWPTPSARFNYTANRDGTVNPDPAWVASYIRTESVPILGRVTCNKVMLPAAASRADRDRRPRAWRARSTRGVRRLLRATVHRGHLRRCPSTPSAPPSTSTCPATSGARAARSTGPWCRSSSTGDSRGAATGTTPTPCTSSCTGSSPPAELHDRGQGQDRAHARRPGHPARRPLRRRGHRRPRHAPPPTGRCWSTSTRSGSRSPTCC